MLRSFLLRCSYQSRGKVHGATESAVSQLSGASSSFARGRVGGSKTKKIAWPPPLPSLSQLGRRQTIFQRFPNTCVNVQLSHKSQNDPEAKTRSESLQIGMLFKPNWVQTARAFQAPPQKTALIPKPQRNGLQRRRPGARRKRKQVEVRFINLRYPNRQWPL